MIGWSYSCTPNRTMTFHSHMISWEDPSHMGNKAIGDRTLLQLEQNRVWAVKETPKRGDVVLVNDVSR
jgi:hypothetical protein